MEPFDYKPPRAGPDILHEDAQLIAVRKPSGLLSVPGRDPTHADCVEARLRRRYPEALLVHRLDMDTSGVMVFARTKSAQRHLGLQFERRHLEKTYEALVWGTPAQGEGQIDLPLIADWPKRPLQKVCHENGRPALTQWRRIEHHENGARLLLFPKTGRSHQLRVHMLALGHPILGDRFYGSDEVQAAAPRLCLHAARLRLRHPDGGAWIEFADPAPF